jgi:hypothetical protein
MRMLGEACTNLPHDGSDSIGCASHPILYEGTSGTSRPMLVVLTWLEGYHTTHFVGQVASRAGCLEGYLWANR